MKLRLLKEWNGKAPGKVGVFLSEYGEQLIKDGIAELLDEALSWRRCLRKPRFSKNQYTFQFQCQWIISKVRMVMKKKRKLINQKNKITWQLLALLMGR